MQSNEHVFGGQDYSVTSGATASKSSVTLLPSNITSGNQRGTNSPGQFRYVHNICIDVNGFIGQLSPVHFSND